MRHTVAVIKRVHIQDRPLTEPNTYMYLSGRQNDVAKFPGTNELKSSSSLRRWKAVGKTERRDDDFNTVP